MAKRLYQFNEIVGQVTNKSIIANQLTRGTLSQFIFLYGESGSGKSTMAELIALSATCERGGVEPCLQCEHCKANLEALATTGISRNIKKVNMGKVTSKEDVKTLIKEIFTLQPLVGEKTFYILEEVHRLEKNQEILLEELERIPQDTHVLMCTTNYRDIMDTLKTRAQLKLNFKRLTHSECTMLINKLKNDYNIQQLNNTDINFLANVTRNNAREITNFLETFRDERDLGTLMRSYFNRVSNKVYLQLIENLFKDFPNFIIALNEFEAQINILDMWAGFHEFIRDAIFYRYCSGFTIFSNTEKHLITELFSKIPVSKIEKLYKLSHLKAKTESDVEYNLILLREFLTDTNVTLTNSNKDAVIENTVAAKQEIIVNNQKKEPPKIKELTMDSINNLTGDNTVYSLDGLEDF